MHLVKKYFCIFPILLLFLFSCRKEEDISAPKITFSSPVENQVFNVYDHVPVKASVTDNTKLTSISVSLVDASQSLVHITVPVPVSSPSTNVDMQYLLDNIHLESGVYYMLISASDGKNDSHGYLKINIVAVPKVLKKVYVTAVASGAQTD